MPSELRQCLRERTSHASDIRRTRRHAARFPASADQARSTVPRQLTYRTQPTTQKREPQTDARVENVRLHPISYHPAQPFVAHSLPDFSEDRTRQISSAGVLVIGKDAEFSNRGSGVGFERLRPIVSAVFALIVSFWYDKVLNPVAFNSCRPGTNPKPKTDC